MSGPETTYAGGHRIDGHTGAVSVFAGVKILSEYAEEQILNHRMRRQRDPEAHARHKVARRLLSHVLADRLADNLADEIGALAYGPLAEFPAGESGCSQPNCERHGKSPCEGVGCDGRDAEDRARDATVSGYYDKAHAPASNEPEPSGYVSMRLVPVEVFGENDCCEHGFAADDCPSAGYGLSDAVPAWSDCNRARGRIYRVDDVGRSADAAPDDTVEIRVRESDLPFFSRVFGDGIDTPRRPAPEPTRPPWVADWLTQVEYAVAPLLAGRDLRADGAWQVAAAEIAAALAPPTPAEDPELAHITPAAAGRIGLILGIGTTALCGTHRPPRTDTDPIPDDLPRCEACRDALAVYAAATGESTRVIDPFASAEDTAP